MTWDLDALKEHLEKRIDESVSRARDALASADKAVLKAEEAANERFRGVNEFRQTLADQQRTFIPRKEAESLFVSLEDRITKLERARTGDAGQQIGVKAGYVWAIGVVAVISTIIGIFLAVTVKGAP